MSLPVVGDVHLRSEAAMALGLWGFGGWASFTVYLLPTIIAFGRRVASRGAILAINILLGWSVIGWLVAFAMSLSSVRDPMPGMYVEPGTGVRTL